jgi:UDP-2,4-diacetamido-2,4,6-trideoxy-beta-L-altropyranose hydrolase
MNLLIRTDAGVRMGTGHVMRCLALAQAWQDAGGRATFALAAGAEGLHPRLASEGVEIQTLTAEPGSADDTRQTNELALRAAWVVLDGYHFSGAYQRALKEAGRRLLVVDDNGHAGHCGSELVLNQNLHADEKLYRDREPGTQLLLGPRHALLRREFRQWRGWSRPIPEHARKVLVTLGGSDPDNVTGKVLLALREVHTPGLETVVVAGAANPHRAHLERAARSEGIRVRLYGDVSDMPGLMAWADVAVAAGGGTSWERALMKLPSLVVVLADNQREVAASLATAGVGWNLGEPDSLSPAGIAAALQRLLEAHKDRAGMARRGAALVDGWGAARVCDRLVDSVLRLRPARADD